MTSPGERPETPPRERTTGARGLVPVLLLHGTAAERDQIARVFHRDSPVRNGRFVRLDLPADEDRLGSALRERTGQGVRVSETSPLHVAERGTLFLDGVGSLAPPTQALLLELMEGRLRFNGRVIGGDGGALLEALATGAFLPALFRALDQVRVELEERSR